MDAVVLWIYALIWVALTLFVAAVICIVTLWFAAGVMRRKEKRKPVHDE